MVLAVQFRILSLSAFSLSLMYNNHDYCQGLSPMGLAAIAAVHKVLLTTPWHLPTLDQVVAIQQRLYPTA
jgi:hypothetical protein